MAAETSIDLEAEGLLEGVEGKEDREARVQLLEQLVEAGVAVEELKQAVAEDRLALLPAELVLAGDGQFTLAEVAEKTGLEEGFLSSLLLALGMPRPGPDDRVASDEDVEAASVVAFFREGGIPDDGILEITRVIGQGMAGSAGAILRHAGEVLLQAGDTEQDLGLKAAEAAEDMVPRATPLLQFLLRVHIREGLREGVVGRLERESGELPGSREVSIAFADLEGFTRLGERIAADDVGRVANRLAILAGDVAEPPVRLVKTIGDAAMLACFDTSALLDAVIRLVQAAEDEGEEFPSLHAGVAHGSALPRNGDWYGAPVNMASRITDDARPATVLVTDDVRERVGEGYSFSRLPPRRLKGIKKRVQLFRARPAREHTDGQE